MYNNKYQIIELKYKKYNVNFFYTYYIQLEDYIIILC